MLKRFFKGLGLGILAVLFVLLVPAGVQYLFCPVYEFPPAHPFEGEHWYNPYENLAENWYKANFHVHSSAWGGMTSGVDSVAAVFRKYRNLDYDIVSISDYHKISGIDNEEWILPAYEHGYNPWKTHQVVLGARRVLWRDFIFGQHAGHKQHILNILRKDCDFLILAHPAFSAGYDSLDLTVLTNYDGVEVLNHYRTSAMHWDAALSAGRPIWLTGSDDSHNVNKAGETGVRWTMINATSKNRDIIIEAMRSGRHFGVMGEGGKCPIRLVSVEIVDERLRVAVEPAADVIRFIGQGGIVRSSSANVSLAVIDLLSSDTYIRTEIMSADCKLFMNPVIRFDGRKLASPMAHIDRTATWLQRALGTVGLTVLVYAVIFIRKKRRKAHTP